METKMTDHSVYMSGKNGPFRCDNCEYYEVPNKCTQVNIIELARKKQFGLKMNGKYAAVDAAGCSDYFEPKESMLKAK